MSDNNNILAAAHKAYLRGDFAFARAKLDPILKQDSQPKAAHLAALIARDMGDYQEALAQLNASLAVTPYDKEVLNTLGTVWVRLQEPVRAELAFSAALDEDINYHAARANLAFCHLNYQNPAAALPLLETLCQIDSKNQVYVIAYIYALKDLHKNEKALKVLETVDTDGEHKEEFAFLKGQILFEMEKYDEAITTNHDAICSPIFGPKAIANMAQTLRMLGQWPTAKIVLERILNKEKTRPEISIAIAHVYHMADETDRAEEILNNAVSRFGDIAEILSLKGRINADQNNPAEAYKLTLDALKMRPGHVDFMAEFSRAAMTQGSIPEAMHAAQSGLIQQPNNQFWMAMRAVGGRLLGTDYKFYFDYEKYVHVFDLDAPKSYKSMAAFNKALSRILESLHGFIHAPLDQSVRIGTQTSPNLIHHDNPILTEFFETVQSPLRQYMTAIGTDPTHPLTRRNTGQARICSAWSVKLDKDGHHVDHIHPEGWISSVYYVDVPNDLGEGTEKSGWLRFGQPPLNLNLDAEYFIKPKAGRLVLFPSYMWHGTVPLKNAGRRLTLPFDVLPSAPKPT